MPSDPSPADVIEAARRKWKEKNTFRLAGVTTEGVGYTATLYVQSDYGWNAIVSAPTLAQLLEEIERHA